MATIPSMTDATARLQRVGSHIEELRQSGRDADADAIAFVRDLAELALAEHGELGRRELLTTGQAGLALGVSDQTVRNWVAAGRLPAVRRGTRTMVPRDAVLEEIERSRIGPQKGLPTSDDEAAITAGRRDLLQALPRSIGERLRVLHEQLEAGHEMTVEKQAELARLEREMADAAARHLQDVVRRNRVGTG